MKVGKIVAFSLLFTASGVVACGKKSDSGSSSGTSGSSSSSEVRDAMADTLTVKLRNAGLSESQIKTIVNKGKAKATVSALALTSSQSLAEISAFASGATDAIDEIGTFPAGKTSKDILSIVAGSNIEALKALKQKVADLDLAQAAATVSKATTASLDDAGFAVQDLDDAMAELAESIAANADSAGVSLGDLDELMQECVSAMMVEMKSISGFENSLYDDLVKAISAGAMLGTKEFDGFEDTAYADFAASLGEAVIDGAGDIPGFDKELYDELAKAVAEGSLDGAGDISGFSSSLYDDIAKAIAEGVMEGAGDVEGFDSTLLDDLSKSVAAGFVEGTAEIPGFDNSILDEITAAIIDGIREGAEDIANVDLNEILQAASDGAQEGAENLDNLSDEILNELKSKTASLTHVLNGSWSSGCVMLKEDEYLLHHKIFIGDKLSEALVYYTAEGCSEKDAIISLRSEATVKVGDPVSDAEGAVKIDESNRETHLTLLTEDAVLRINGDSSSNYGFTDWVLNIEKNITGKNEKGFVESTGTLYSMFRVDGDEVCFAEEYDDKMGTGFDGSSEEKRLNIIGNAENCFTKK